MPEDTQPIAVEAPRIVGEGHGAVTRPNILTRFRSWLLRDSRASHREHIAWLTEELADTNLRMRLMQVEWAEYQTTFNDLITRHSALLARQAKMEKKRLERLDREGETPAPSALPVGSLKQQLRSQFAMSRYGGRVQAILAAKGTQHEHDSEGREMVIGTGDAGGWIGAADSNGDADGGSGPVR